MVLRNAAGAFALVAVLCGTAAAQQDDYAQVNQLLRAGRHADALARAEQYLAGKPRDPQMRFLKGVAQTSAGRNAEAAATFTALTQDHPELPEPYNNLAVLHAAQGEYEKARAALEMAVRLNPGYGTAHENLGDVYARLAGQAYARAAQLGTGTSTVAPKLDLIRQLLAAPAGSPAASAR